MQSPDPFTPQALHHVQLAMPEGGEAVAREFYGGLLGLPEVAKPAVLSGRGGVWFESGGLRLHLGVARPFVAAAKAHPGLALASVAALEALARRLEEAGTAVIRDPDYPGYRRFYAADPFGNRLEFLTPEL
ncbi:VOC family protein [Frigidibacter sp. ROC022]|uniref:VOC family protein n=1 Tax=Frigidibacter sp. ROC022 TaxID=2971796 RepID=UPI00215A9085|nr:VOC family protein [Frigidibacter sp. ROC022]MCR8722901.1 VOC family protein [Frigidibacter sp. ROC022]